MKAIRIHETGGPEVMHLEEIETPTPEAGEILIKVAVAGVNYADLAQRAGAYLTPTRTPTTPGVEIAGTIAALGTGVNSPAVGTRVAAFCEGGYAEYAISQANMVIPISSGIDFIHAAAFPLQGITAYQLLREVSPHPARRKRFGTCGSRWCRNTCNTTCKTYGCRHRYRDSQQRR